jgi:hypothetical protein
MIDFLKKHGSAEAGNPKTERILADLAAAGFATRKGNVYIYGHDSWNPFVVVRLAMILGTLLALVIASLVDKR